jgi:predicted nucleotidyltransferase
MPMLEPGGIANKFAELLKEKFRDNVRKIFIFGSRAKNVAMPGSDYDFLIVLKQKDRRVIDAIYDEVVSFLVDYGVDISLKIYSEDDFNRKLSQGIPFVVEAVKSGVEL